MWRGFSKLTRADWIVVAAGLMLCVMLGVMPPLGQATAPQDGVMSDEALREMTMRTRAAYDKWRREAKFHGAFAISENGRAWGWSDDHNTMDAARINALAHCDNNGSGCVIIDMRPDPQGGETAFGSAAVRAQIAVFQRNPGAGAMAVSDNGASFWVSGRATLQEAEAAALEGCEAARKRGQAAYLPDWPCRVHMRTGR